jgi:poly(A) polymerase
MFFDPVKEELVDFVGGRTDLDAKILRAIGDPAARFAEDKLRILRGVRIAARFDLSVDAATLAAAKAMAPEIRVVSPERIADELRKLLAHPNRAHGVKLLSEFGLVDPILPELAGGGSEKWRNGASIVEALPNHASFPLAFAALLQPLDRPAVEQIADRLRLSGAEKARIAWLVEMQESLDEAPVLPLSRLKTILIQPGIEDLIALHRARACSRGSSPAAADFCAMVLHDTPVEVLNPPPLLTGEDLIAMGRKPGPEFKRILDTLREAQLEGRVRSKNEAIEMAKGLSERGQSTH